MRYQATLTNRVTSQTEAVLYGDSVGELDHKIALYHSLGFCQLAPAKIEPVEVAPVEPAVPKAPAKAGKAKPAEPQ